MERKWLVLAAVMLGSVMGPIDASVVNVVLPTIAEVFGTGISTAQWVPMVYLLMISSLLLTYGRLGDMHGYRAVYLAGLAGFAASSAVCGLSGSIGMLIAARAVQGVTAGMMAAARRSSSAHSRPPNAAGRRDQRNQHSDGLASATLAGSSRHTWAGGSYSSSTSP